MTFASNGMEAYGVLVATLQQNEYGPKQKKLKLYMKHYESPSMKPSIQEALKLDLKALPPHLSYMFIERNDTLSVIIAAYLNGQQV